jgi:serine/threonine protein kinase/thioredoxin-like negative regulator of GroEL
MSPSAEKPSTTDPDVATLVGEERLLEAAALAGARGDAALASQLYERACDWASAAAQAMAHGDAPRALELAAEAGSESLAERAAAGVPREAAEGTASRLMGRGHPRYAAILLEANDHPVEAAGAWERAGHPVRAAELLERSGDPAGAARVLESALRRDPTAWKAATALGALLARFGKHEAAVRVLQRVPGQAPERLDALVHLVAALERLGLARASADAGAELVARGGALPGKEPERAAPLRQRVFGRYDVIREAASSPSARVLECTDVVRGERVAVKVFAAWDTHGSGRDALARFEREVRTMRVLDHPNIVPLRDYIPEGPAIVLAWMGGGTLERMLATPGMLAPARAVEIAASLLAALGEAHRLGILHRDVKPSNVLFDEAGGAHLGDFGVAHLGDLSTTATAGLFGTLSYMSPEQRQGRPATARSDVFAVGTILREMLTGERPRPGEPTRLRPSDAHGELDARHDAAVSGLAAVDPEERPADAFEARSVLGALPWPVTSGTPVSAARIEREPATPPPPGRLQSTIDGIWLDTWTGRAIERVPLSDRTLCRARAFAGADHPALQGILRVDPDDQTLWLDAARSRPLDRSLTPAERARLAGALEALHATGAVHGRVDADHLGVDESGVMLRFAAEEDSTATLERDRLALSRL